MNIIRGRWLSIVGVIGSMILVTTCASLSNIKHGSEPSTTLPALPQLLGGNVLLEQSFAASPSLTQTTKAVSAPGQWALGYAFNCSTKPTAKLDIFANVPGSSFEIPTSMTDYNAQTPSSYVGGKSGSDMLYYHAPANVQFDQLSFGCPWSIEVIACPPRGCGMEPTTSTGVTTLSGIGSYDSRINTIRTTTAFALSYNCTAHYRSGTDGSGQLSSYDGAKMVIQNANDMYDAQTFPLNPGPEADSWETYVYPTQPMQVFETISTDCPWTISFGPPSLIHPAAQLAPGPNISLPKDTEGFATVIQNDVGEDTSYNTALFTVPASGWSVDYAYECYQYTTDDISFTVTLEAPPAGNVSGSVGGQSIVNMFKGKLQGSGSFAYGTAGTFYLAISSDPACYWHVAIKS